jgi:hypothetical protein
MPPFLSYPLGSVPMPGTIGVTNQADVYPTHYDFMGKGGHRTVDTRANITNIPAARRSFGMLVTVTNDPDPLKNKTYILCNSEMDPTCTDDPMIDTNWKEFSTGGTLPTFEPYRYVYTDVDGNLTDGLYTNKRLLQEFAGDTFSEKLIDAGFSASGVIVDCTGYTGVQTLDATVQILNPCQFLFSNIEIQFESIGINDHMFFIQSPGVSIIGNGRSPKFDQQSTTNTKFVMTNNYQSQVRGGYHIFSADYESFLNGQNVCLLQGFDCIGVQSQINSVAGNVGFPVLGVGGICLLEGNPFVGGGGNTISQIQIRDILADGTRDHGILIIGAILAQVVNCRVSRAGGHGFYIGGTTSAAGFEGGGTTSTYVLNCYASSGNLAGFCMHAAAYSQLQNCAAEYFGMGYFLRSCQNVSLFGCGAEENQPKNNIPNNLNIEITNDQGTYVLNDIGSGNGNFFKGTSYWISGGRNIYIPNAYSKDPGGVYEYINPTTGALVPPLAPSSNTSHFTIIGEVRSAYLVNPRITGTAIVPYCISVRKSGTGANAVYPRDINIMFNPNDDRPTSTAGWQSGPGNPINTYDPYEEYFPILSQQGVPITSISYTRNSSASLVNGKSSTTVNAIVLIEDGNVYDASANPWTYKCQVEVKNGNTYYTPLVLPHLIADYSNYGADTEAPFDPGDIRLLAYHDSPRELKWASRETVTNYTFNTRHETIYQAFSVNFPVTVPSGSRQRTCPIYAFEMGNAPSLLDPLQTTDYMEQPDPYDQLVTMTITGFSYVIADTQISGECEIYIRVWNGTEWTNRLIDTIDNIRTTGQYHISLTDEPIFVYATDYWGVYLQNTSTTDPSAGFHSFKYRVSYSKG